MSKMFKKCLSLFLCATLLLCVFTIQSFAVEKNGILDGGKNNKIETAIEVTGDFTATINKEYMFYKFTPTQSGFYRVSGDLPDIGAYLWVYDSLMNDIDYNKTGSFWNYSSDTGFEEFLNLEAGETYYFEIGLYYDEVLLTGSVSFDVSIDYLGSITGATLVSPPDKLTYIKGVDEYDYTSPDFIYYEFYFDITGAFADVTFSQGQTYTLCDYALEIAFEKSYDTEKRHLGVNNVYFSYDGTVMFTFTITLIENPVESIEIVRLPDKTVYTFGIDGSLDYDYFYPQTDFTGLQVKINYTGGTSKTVDWENSEDYGSGVMIVNGYPLYADCYGTDEPGDAAVEVYYLTKTAEFNISINSPSFFEKLSILFNITFTATLDSFSELSYLPYILFAAPINFFTMLFKLIKM